MFFVCRNLRLEDLPLSQALKGLLGAKCYRLYYWFCLILVHVYHQVCGMPVVSIPQFSDFIFTPLLFRDSISPYPALFTSPSQDTDPSSPKKPLFYASSSPSHLSLPYTTLNIYLIYRPGQHQVRLKGDMKPLGPTQADLYFRWKGQQFHPHQRTGLGASECILVSSHIHYSFNSQSGYWLYSRLDRNRAIVW